MIIATKILTGGVQYALCKVILDWKVPDDDGSIGKFGKNIFMAVVTFFAMLLVIAPYFYKEVADFNASRKLAGQTPSYPYSKRAHILCIIPGILEAASILLSTWSNKTLSATTVLLLKSLKIPVTALMTVFYMKRPLKVYHWAAVAITILGVIPIGLAESMERECGQDKEQAMWLLGLSIGMIVLSEVIKGVRGVLEEKLIQVEKLSTESVRPRYRSSSADRRQLCRSEGLPRAFRSHLAYCGAQRRSADATVGKYPTGWCSPLHDYLGHRAHVIAAQRADLSGQTDGIVRCQRSSVLFDQWWYVWRGVSSLGSS
jgi:Nucleotide-sugar transporter